MTLEKQQRGSLATEVVLLVPILMLMVMFIVFVGRVQSASMAVRGLAAQGRI
jgi:Flp pilus assembly protein TadG